VVERFLTRLGLRGPITTERRGAIAHRQVTRMWVERAAHPGQDSVRTVSFRHVVEEINVGKPSNKTAEDKARIVVAVLKGEVTAIEAARLEGVSEQSIHHWKATFLESGRAGLAARARRTPSSREVDLQARVDELDEALAEAQVRLRALQQGDRSLPPSKTSR
jgi:transposase